MADFVLKKTTADAATFGSAFWGPDGGGGGSGLTLITKRVLLADLPAATELTVSFDDVLPAGSLILAANVWVNEMTYNVGNVDPPFIQFTRPVGAGQLVSVLPTVPFETGPGAEYWLLPGQHYEDIVGLSMFSATAWPSAASAPQFVIGTAPGEGNLDQLQAFDITACVWYAASGFTFP
jgi:hypothetical protein